MKKYFMITLGLILTVLAGCSSQDMPDTPMNDNPAKAAKSEKQLAIERYIDRNHKSVTRGEDVALLPYVVDGDTVMYVANYPGGGFEIFSNDLALPMVLVKSKTGEYNPYGKIVKAPFDEFLAEAGEVMAENQNSDNAIAPNITWSVYSNREEEGGGEGGMEYVGTAYELDNEIYTPRGGRLVTKWGQDYPYNQYTPLYTGGSGGHAPTGCGTILAGQYILHSHRYFNKPVTTVTTATYNSTSNAYTFSGNSSIIWNSMSNGSTDPNTLKATAIFLGYIAKEVKTDFYGTTAAGLFSASDSDVGLCIESQCGLHLTKDDFTVDRLIDVLYSGHPAVMFTSFDKYTNNTKTGTAGHAYLVDYLSHIMVTYYDVYAQANGDPGIDDNEDEENSVYGNSLNYYYNKYGVISTRPLTIDHEYWMSMNWGWEGESDNLEINAEIASWSIYRSGLRLKATYTGILH